MLKTLAQVLTYLFNSLITQLMKVYKQSKTKTAPVALMITSSASYSFFVDQGELIHGS